LVFSNQENQEYLKKSNGILLNHKHPTEIIKQFEVFQIQFENPTINASVKYSINNKINNYEYNNKCKNQGNGNRKNNPGNIRKPEYNNFASNQNEYISNNGFLDINGHFKAELLERNKLTCSFRKLKSNNAFSNKNSGLNNTSNNLLDDTNLNNIKPPFQYASVNNKNQNNNYNTNNSNLNYFNGNNYNTKDTISKKKAMYQSINQSILNCSSSAIKIFWTKQEQTAKNIEEGFEKLQKLARKLKIIENNKQNTRLSCVIKYDDLFDILEFKGMEKERDIIDKHIQQKIKRTNTEVKKPFKKNLIEFNDESVANFSEIKKNYAKNNFDSNSKIDIQDKEFNYNNNNEINAFSKENFLSTAAFNTATKKIRDLEFSSLNNEYKKEDYSTNIYTNDKNLEFLNAPNHIQSINNENFDKEKKNFKLKIKTRENHNQYENSDDQNIEEVVELGMNKAVVNPFRTHNNHNTASKGLPPTNKNLLTSCKKGIIQPQHFSTTKKIKKNDFKNSPKIRSSSGASKNIYNFNEKIEMASKIPFGNINSNFDESRSNINFSADKNFEKKQIDGKLNKLDAINKNNVKFINQIVLNSHNKEFDRIIENNENFDSMNIKVNSREFEMNNDLIYQDKKFVKNPFKKEQHKTKMNYFSNKTKITENYESNYASNNALSNFNSNNRESSLLYKTNDKYNKSNYNTNDLRETINENSQITSASIISYNNEFNSNLQSKKQNFIPFNVITNNMKTNEVYTSNSFADFNSEMVESEYCSNISNFKNNKKNVRNCKKFKNDFDNYEEYESAMRKIEMRTEEEDGKIIQGKRVNTRNFNSNRNNNKKRHSNNSNKNNATESDFISDFSKNSRISNNSQINNFSYITRSSISDMDI